ncbi:MAG: hypothetical protein JJ934_08015 [Pseudomonadales bacterium]|nr:hypothetical protein [Pseudomonadales bacterium]MBO6564665.1 hypothetical protein [Pseudomonadales bacterium]MBO6595958.1 hypothetical protein [Pseudomonadales bacterium]MBO6656824.1 hypothetical protein [Pseudomonadales bacterium]MBO6702563.1 hypothetical protein [Pseudomonadales bacterium]
MSTKVIDIAEFADECLEIIEELGETTVIITRDGKPFALVEPVLEGAPKKEPSKKVIE